MEAAYRRGDALEKRRAMMQEWADFCYPGNAEGKSVTMAEELRKGIAALVKKK